MRFLWPPEYARVTGREKGYVYFQDFIPDNKFDIRIFVIGDKAYANLRKVRKNDFRASGSGEELVDKELISDEILKLSFEMLNCLILFLYIL